MIEERLKIRRVRDDSRTIRIREIEYLSPYATLSKDLKEERQKKRNVISDRYFKETGIEFCTVRHSKNETKRHRCFAPERRSLSDEYRRIRWKSAECPHDCKALQA